MSTEFFNNNKYTSWYFHIIGNAKLLNRQKSENLYLENHHIIPRCLGGLDNDENRVNLTAREHFICHWLLTKMCNSKNHTYKLEHAFTSFVKLKKKRSLSSKQYEVAKKYASKLMSQKMSGKDPWNKGLKGVQVAWNKDKELPKQSEELVTIRMNSIKAKWAITGHNRKDKDPWNKGLKGVQEPWNKGTVRPKVQCPYCPKEGSVENMKRWHFDNCKFREHALQANLHSASRRNFLA